MADGQEGILFVFTGPSGAGKGTIMTAFRRKYPDVYFSVSATTRPRRKGEEQGVHYDFVTREKFETMLADGAFLEHACYVDNLYGTPAEPVRRALHQGKNVILEIDVQGALTVKEKMRDAVMIFAIPSDFSILEERLKTRGTEDEGKIQKRLEMARKEYESARRFDYIILNDRVDQAVTELISIMAAERCRTEKRKQYLEVCAK